MRIKSFLKKPCKKCGISFLPNSHQNTICENCFNKITLLNHLKKIKESIDRAINREVKYKKLKNWYKNLVKSAEIFDVIIENLDLEIRKNK